MSIPTSREEFINYCLRNLGWPTIEINLDDDTIYDRVDEALKYYMDFHTDGSERTYYKHVITQTDKDNKYITLPENIIGAVRVFNIGSRLSSINNLFGVQYQLALNELYTFTSYSMIPYYMGIMHLELIDQILVGEKPIRYNRHRNILHVDMNWEYIEVGQYLVVEAFMVVDPDEFTDVWGDRLLAKYCTQLIKRNWGQVMKKYNGMTLPNGITFNGQTIYDEADAEIQRLETEFINTYSLPSMALMIGVYIFFFINSSIGLSFLESSLWRNANAII